MHVYTFKKRKLRWFGHISRSSGLAKTILRALCKRKEAKIDRRRGGKTILRSGKVWTLLAQLGAAEDRTRWKEIVVKSAVVPQRSRKVME